MATRVYFDSGVIREYFFEPKTITQIAKETGIPKQKIRQRIDAINGLGNLISESKDGVRPKFFVANNSGHKILDNPYARVCFFLYNDSLYEQFDWIDSKSFSNDYVELFAFEEHKDVKRLKKDFFKVLSNPKALYLFLEHWEPGSENFYDSLWKMPNFKNDPFEYLESFNFETMKKRSGKRRYVCGLLNQFYSEQKTADATEEAKEALSLLTRGLRKRGRKPRKPLD